MSETLAQHGGAPVRETLLPYGRQSIDKDDVAAVVEALGSDYLTTGPRVGEFEQAIADRAGARHGCAVNSGTAALHAMVDAAGIGPGAEVIVPPMTFAATANVVLYQGARPVFADIDPATLNIDPDAVRAAVTPRTRAILSVDFAGNPVDYDALRAIATEHKLALLSDAAHALGATYHGKPVGAQADATEFSLHPVKQITTGEGGVAVTDDPEWAARMRRFRSHGIATDARQRETAGAWHYEMVDLGYNYRIPDLNCALGLSQLAKLSGFVARRREIAARYDAAFADLPEVTPLATTPDAESARHIYPVLLGLERLKADRNLVFQALRAEGIGVNVHYIPVHLHPYYRERMGTGPGLCPVAEAAYERLITLPLFPAMTDRDAEDAIAAVRKVVAAYRK